MENQLFHFKNLDDLNEEFDLKNGVVLGKGAFGEVLKCQSSVDLEHYAIKIMQEKLGNIDFKEVEIT